MIDAIDPRSTPPSTVSANAIVSSLLTVQTSGPGFLDLTSEVAKFVEERARGRVR